MGAATIQQAMGVIVGSAGGSAAAMSAGAFHSAFMLPVTGLAFSIVLYVFAKDFGQQ
jgi:hypothetical protein